MSLSLCMRCFGRLQIQPIQSIPSASTSLTQTSTFTTSSPNYGGGGRTRARGKNLGYRLTFHVRKKRTYKKLPPVGERRMQRTRIVLSNTNALEVKGLHTLNLRNCAQDSSFGRVLAFDDATIDRLREAKGFKRTQTWNLFRRPATLMREESIHLGKMILQERDKPETNRVLVTGERISGKSVLLAQAMAMASMKEWVVITVPEAVEFTMNHFAYAPSTPSSGSEEQMYRQTTLAAGILSRMAGANAAVLSKLKPNNALPQAPSFRPEDKKNLYTLAKYGAEVPARAPEMLTYLLSELTQPGQHHRPPVLITIDGVDHWMGLTKYFTPDMTPIHAHQFLLIRTFLDLLFSSKATLGNGGIVLGATTASNAPNVPAFDLLIRQLAALNNGIKPDDPTFPLPGPYQYLDPRPLRLLDPAANTRIMRLQGLSKSETGALMEYFALSGVLKEDITNENISEKWTLSGNGIIGQLCALGQRSRIDPEKPITKFGTDEGVKMGKGEHRPRKT